jgi:hypothetical protein
MGTRPTTTAGVVALLDYAEKFDTLLVFFDR